MTRPQLCTPEERERILHSILNALNKDSRIAGVVLVGSGAVGFEDEYSDIDLSVVVGSRDNIEAVFREWGEKFRQTLPLVGYFETRYAADNLLWGFLLDNYLEIDMGFLCLENLVARSERWEVVFDRSGKIDGILRTTWANKPSVDIKRAYLGNFNGVWHYITHVAICAKRGQLLRALYYLNELRDDIVEVAGMRLGLRTGNYRDVDCFPAVLRRKLEQTLVGRPDRAEIMRALKAATVLFFEEAEKLERKLGLNNAGALKAKMLEYISFFGD